MQNSNGAFQTSTISLQPDPERPLLSGDDPYFLVIESGSSSVFWLPPRPEILIGRSLEADLHLRHGSVSRMHARIVRQGELLCVCDLGSHNGVLVNGERVESSSTIYPGDVVAIGDVLLILQRGGPSAARRVITEQAVLRQRLGEEVERALRFSRRVTLLHIELDPALSVQSALEAKLYSLLRPFDTAAILRPGQLAVVMPDLWDEEIEEPARQILTALAPTARGGYSTCPADGQDADTLLFLSRQAARNGVPSQLNGPMAVPVRRSLGGREILIADPAMLRMYELIERLGASLLPVLIRGETGSGKEIATAALHQASPRRGQRLLAINCAALPESLAESELFGHDRGAFSGAHAQKAGLLESAPGGTLFLDEIAELSLAIQAKLLRALETQRVIRVGETQERPIDVRLVAATHRNLEAEVKAGRFRQDLYFRLSAAVVILPPLRHRTVELPMLARMFLRAARQRLGRSQLTISDPAMALLLAYPWPGNVRELQNDMEYLAAVVQDESVEHWHLPPKLGGPPLESSAPRVQAGDVPSSGTAPSTSFRPLESEVRALERQRILEALTATGGIQIRAAELLGMPRRTFFAKVKQYGISARVLKEPA